MIKALEKAPRNSGDEKKAVGGALAKINEMLCRFNNNCVGGINKSSGGAGNVESKAQIEHLKFVNADAARATDIQKQIEEITVEIRGLNASEGDRARIETLKEQRKDAKSGLKEFLERAKLDEVTIKENFNVLKRNVETLRNYQNEKSVGLEEGLNLIQKTCLSAWMFNDIQEEVGNAIGKEEVGKFFLGKTKKCSALIRKPAIPRCFKK